MASKKTTAVNIGNTEKNRQAVSDALKKILSDESVLYTKTRNFHWNVKGISFAELHKFFEQQYDELAMKIDEVAERIRQLGHTAPGTMASFIKLASLKEQDSEGMDAIAMLNSLLQDHEAVIRNLRSLISDFDEKYNDAGSADFITGLMEEHEKMAWMIRSYLG